MIILPRLAGGSGDDLVNLVCFCCVGFEVGLGDGLIILEESKRGAFLVGVTAPSCVILKIPGPCFPGPGPSVLPPLFRLVFLVGFYH